MDRFSPGNHRASIRLPGKSHRNINFAETVSAAIDTFDSRMSKIAGILLILFSFSLGGVQVIFTAGKFLARQRALHVRQVKTQEAFRRLTIDARTFGAIEKEEVGNGVSEFEYKGHRYDVFDISFEGDAVHLLVMEDDLDTAVHRFYKMAMRYLRKKSEDVKYSVFNFYFSLISQPVSMVEQSREIGYKTFLAGYFLLNIDVDFPPPEGRSLL